MPTKTKISITVPRNLLESVDRGVKQRRWKSRSEAISCVMEKLAREQRDAEIDAYYDAETEEDREAARAREKGAWEAFTMNPRDWQPAQPRRRRA